LVVGASVATVPPRSSVLPPGAGNEEAKKAVKPGKKGAKKVEGGYAARVKVAEGHGQAAAVCRHDDGDPVLAAEEAHALQLLLPALRRVRAV
jgi:hypothetical protein